jgi:hypothetical protein
MLQQIMADQPNLARHSFAGAPVPAGAHFSTLIRQDQGALRGWCASCDALCDTAFYLLHIVGQVSGIDTTVARYMVCRARQPAQQHQGQEDMQQHQQVQEPHAAGLEGPHNLVHLDLDPAVTAVLPVLAASSLRLVHASLACVRLLNAQFRPGGQVAGTRLCLGGYQTHSFITLH